MYKEMKRSKYNFTTYDHEGNLLLYNFLTGTNSLTIVKKTDVDKFTQLFLRDDVIRNELCDEYNGVVAHLVQKGFLVANNVNESELLDSQHYNEAYDRKLILAILPTGKCNFNCPYCYEKLQPFHRNPMTIDAQNALIKFVRKNISKYSEVHVAWYGGEPLLEPEIIKYISNELIGVCNKRYLPYSAEMVTNGYMLDADMFDMLYKLRVYNYMVTIDGLKAQHDKLRCLSDGSGSFDKIINNLRRIRDCKQYKFARILIRINVSQGFFHQFNDFMCFLKSEFSYDSRFRFKFVPVTPICKETYFNTYVDPAILLDRLNNSDIYKNNFVDDDMELFPLFAEPKCMAAKKNSYVITPDLGVYKCYSHFELEENKIGQVDLNGNLIIDDKLHQRWYVAKRYIHDFPEPCKECIYLPCCRLGNPGCPLRYNHQKVGISCVAGNLNFEKSIAQKIQWLAKNRQCAILNF